MNPRTRAIAVRRQRILGVVEGLADHVGHPSTIRIADALGYSRWSMEGVQLYNDLRAMERRGLVTRIRRPDYRDVFWNPRGELTDAEANHLIDSMDDADA